MENQQLAGKAQSGQKKKNNLIAGCGLVFFVVILIAIIGSVISKPEKKETNQEAQKPQGQPVVDNAKEPAQISQEEPRTADVEQTKSEEIKLPKYEIGYEIDKYHDGVISYFILIDPVNLSNDNFKTDIKNIVNKIVKEKGSKIFIDFVDNKNILDLEYKSHYGSNTLGRILTKDEMDKLGLHLIASFTGEFKSGSYLNSLSFFPATFKDNPKVGKYVESIEFNPNNLN